MDEPRMFRQEELEEVRQYAAAALTGLLAGNRALEGATDPDFATEAFRLAELMLDERVRRTAPKKGSKVT